MVAAAARLFLERGYEATAIDELVVACGLHRGSLYKAFGSKRGIFLAARNVWSGNYRWPFRRPRNWWQGTRSTCC